MGKPLSEDLRSGLVAAVMGGLSRRGAAARFGVSAASAVRWVAVLGATGATRAKPQGGDTRSHRIEACREVILAAVAAQKDVTLTELSELLAREHGQRFARSTVWRMLARPALTFKNRSRRRAGPPRRGRATAGVVRRAA